MHRQMLCVKSMLLIPSPSGRRGWRWGGGWEGLSVTSNPKPAAYALLGCICPSKVTPALRTTLHVSYNSAMRHLRDVLLPSRTQIVFNKNRGVTNLFSPPIGSQLFRRPLRRGGVSLLLKITFKFTRKKGSFLLLLEFHGKSSALSRSFSVLGYFPLKSEKAREAQVTTNHRQWNLGASAQTIFVGFKFWGENKHKCSSPKGRGGARQCTNHSAPCPI